MTFDVDKDGKSISNVVIRDIEGSLAATLLRPNYAYIASTTSGMIDIPLTTEMHDMTPASKRSPLKMGATGVFGVA